MYTHKYIHINTYSAVSSIFGAKQLVELIPLSGSVGEVN